MITSNRALFTTVLLLIGFSAWALQITNESTLLASADAKDRLKAYELLEKKNSISKDEVRMLIERMKDYSGVGRVRPDGPDTGETPITRVLVKHSRESAPFLLESIKSEDWDIRRYSAFCLGLIGDPSSIPDLRVRIIQETKMLSKERITVGTGTGPSELPLFILRAVVQAYARIAPRDEFQWLLSLPGTSEKSIQNYVANYSLAILLKPGYPDFAFTPESIWLSQHDKWDHWWSAQKQRSDSDIFRYNAYSSDHPSAELTVTPQPLHSDLKKLLEPYSLKLLCSARPCTLTLEQLFMMITKQTGLKLTYSGVSSTMRLKIESLSASDSLIFAIDSANLQYRINGDTITLISRHE
jgi:hypothetical protein